MERRSDRVALDDSAICDRYIAGETEQALARAFGVSRSAIKRRLINAGIIRRTMSEAHRLRASKMTASERSAQAAAAHDAVRNRRQTDEHRCKIALTNEVRQHNVSRIDRRCAALLEARGVACIINKAVGRYNVDVALTESRIAVEVFGGHWHTTGRAARRFRKRFDYIIDSGWLPVVVWVTPDCPLESGAIKYIIALAERLSLDESLRTQEHVIRGDGQPTGIGKSQLDYRAVIGGDKTGELVRSDDGRFSNQAVRM